MSRKIYNKLIRDRIPEIIDADGKQSKISVLSDTDYDIELKKKLIEEAKELQSAEGPEEIINELADLLELIETIAGLAGIGLSEIEQKKNDKRQKRGGFEKKLFLEYVEE